LEGCKWDPQVGDVSTIAEFPVFLGPAAWRDLAAAAERLTSELLAAEAELLRRPHLHVRLGLSRGLRAVLRRAVEIGPTPGAARVMRFDFHLTPDGWRISEVNSDVPGGFTESSELPIVMRPHYSGAHTAGHPGAAWADAIAAAPLQDRSVALLAAAGYIEDQQILAYLARQLERRRVAAAWASPDDLFWRSGAAHMTIDGRPAELGAIVRFYQGEWLNPGTAAPLFVGGRTPVCNPGIAILTESKRLPLVWDQLQVALPAWRRLLPETRDPREAPWRTDSSWLVKSAFCNTGDTVRIRSLFDRRAWAAATLAPRLRPSRWVAQRRFLTLPIDTPRGQMFPCIGVYTINGRAAGIYGRISPTPLIDYSAIDVAVLIDDSESLAKK